MQDLLQPPHSNKSILNHLFLPCHLPNSAEEDFLIRNDHQNEYQLLESMDIFLKSLDEKLRLPSFFVLSKCISRWTEFQNPNTICAARLQNAIDQLAPGDYFPLYFVTHNAALLTEIDPSNLHRPLLSAWQVQLSTKNITSSALPHFSCFPAPTFELHDRTELRSTAHCELLIDLMKNSLEYSQSYRRARSFDETREITMSHYVTDWWITHFQTINNEPPVDGLVYFRKKHRDQIRWKDAEIPFRRSGLWMTMKTVVQTILTKQLEQCGKIVYKLLITLFLIDFIHTRQRSSDYRISNIDLLMHCLKKIARRLNKIRSLGYTIGRGEISSWAQHAIYDTEMKLNEMIPSSTWQIPIQKDKDKRQRSLKIPSNFSDRTFYSHVCQKLKAYLDEPNPSLSQQHAATRSEQNDSIQTSAQFEDELPSLTTLTTTTTETMGNALTVTEIWLETCLDRWMQRLSLATDGTKRFEELLELFEVYQKKALEHYSTDSLGYTRFILASLTILRATHRKLCAEARFARLPMHSVTIPHLFDLFKFLNLPNREEMSRARELNNYFQDFCQKTYPDVLSNIDSSNAFGVYFASQSTEMKDTLRQIRAEAERDKQAKIQEVHRAKERYDGLMSKVNALSCQCTYGYNTWRRRSYRIKCDRCRMKELAECIRVDIYECPIPSNEQSALAVVFELQMPAEFRCYREILWQFVNRPRPDQSISGYKWLEVPPHQNKLKKFCIAPSQRKVNLTSRRESLTQTHYSRPLPVGSTPLVRYLHENSLDVQISSTRLAELSEECRILTPQLEHPNYKPLQFSVSSTDFEQNRVIAQSTQCPSALKVTEFIEYGSFRSGHRLQWWNLLSALELDSLSFDHESVVLLLTHSLIQNGPMTSESTDPWCSESHRALLDDHFVDELIARLDRRFDDCQSNWQNEMFFLLLSIVTMRILSISNPTRMQPMIELAYKCRTISEESIDKITKILQKTNSVNISEAEKLRDKIVVIATACLFTFAIHPHRQPLSDQAMVSLLKSATSVHDNLILNKNPANSSVFMQNLIRWRERALLQIQPAIAQFLQRTSYQSLHQFTETHWGVIRTSQLINGLWHKQSRSVYDGQYEGHYGSVKISLDCFRGRFLVNGMSVGYLPDEITSNALFRRTFGQQTFEVEAAGSPNTYITKHSFHNKKVYYDFHFNRSNQRLTIQERNPTGEILELIPHSYFQSDFAEEFVNNYSHWLNRTKKCIQFRPIRFRDAYFSSHVSYTLLGGMGFYLVKNVKPVRFVINQASLLFQNLYQRYFRRLDDQPYVYMFANDVRAILKGEAMPIDFVIDIHLSRLGLAFQFDVTHGKIFSREYSDMYIDVNQFFGTLTGLTAGLLLTPMGASDGGNLSRKFIISFGKIQTRKLSENAHQAVSVQRTATMEFAQQYFVFTLNDRLRLLQSSDSPTGWLYLALLHAMTSNPLPDIYTGMTGMERAFQLLNSAGCCSDQPYDSLSLNIAQQIAAISPQVNYYPVDLTCMETIQWHQSGLPHSLQHFGYYLLIHKLIQESQKLTFLYPSSDSKKYNLPSNNVRLLGKLYWDYRDSLNPIAQLPAEMEAKILKEHSSYSYEHPSTFDYQITDSSSVRHMDDLYSSGDLNLTNPTNLTCYPLNRWMNEDNAWKNDFIALLKMVDSGKNDRNARERLQILLNFLHYISKKRAIKPFYLKLLKTILNDQSISLSSLTFPPFRSYTKIKQYRVHTECISFSSWSDINEEAKIRILSDITNCFQTNRPYSDELKLLDEKMLFKDAFLTQINSLLESWHLNEKLREFVQSFQTVIDSIQTHVPFQRLPITQPEFPRELPGEHYRIAIKFRHIPIDPVMLFHARRKYCQPFSGDLIRPSQSTPITNKKRPFPDEIFPSTNKDENPLSDIANFLKTQLTISWQKLQSVQEFYNEYAPIANIAALLVSVQQESGHMWIELIRSIRTDNELLFDTGLSFRLTPAIFVSLLHQIWLNEAERQPSESSKKLKIDRSADLFLTDEQCILFGGVLVNWIIEQQLQRTIRCAEQNRHEDFEREVANTPHANWTPSEHVPWLIFELEMNLTIRKVQVDVARHMIDASGLNSESNIKNIVMQLNMGEGKTSVIVPMLALCLCSPNSSLVRIVVLKSLLIMNYQSLRWKLGGLLNRRIFPFACRRQMNFNASEIHQISQRFQQGLTRRDVLLTAPEYILSFDLLTIDQCRRHQFEVSRSMLSVQRWLKRFARDVFDESDEILHVKYQLVYTIGSQQPVDGGAQRWKTIQSILALVKKHAETMALSYHEDVSYEKSARSSHFPSFRLLSDRPFDNLASTIVHDWLTANSYRQEERQLLFSFLLQSSASMDSLNNRFPPDHIQRFLILRGLLSSQVLLLGLSKRHRVNFGVNPDPKFDRLMAVPFRAKDVAADNTEFGHPDIAIVLTQLFYYYEGLTEKQLLRCLKRLGENEKHPEEIYQEWINSEDEDHLDPTIRRWDDINLKDEQKTRTILFPTLHKNMFVVDYFLNHFVFPQEAKQFPQKLISSAWDLSSDDRTHVITGFSGTNDTQLLLPIHIQQCDLPELKKTDALVLNHLLQAENEFYQSLPISATVEKILQELVNEPAQLHVILDVGALFVNGSNREIAIQWLKVSNTARIDYAVYFQSDALYVGDRQNHHQPFNTSPASERLERCVFYLDEVHTRGTDLKFPKGFRAVVTLGNGLTKDRFVQACMRMRRLGKGHSLKFCSSHEVDQRIRMLKKNAHAQEQIRLSDILRWVYENTQQATWDGLHHWAAQSLTFQRKTAAFRGIQWRNEGQQFTDMIMEQLFRECVEGEVLELTRMYGMSKSMQKIAEIHRSRCRESSIPLASKINGEVLRRLNSFGGVKTLLAQSFDEEQEREFEREVEQEIEQEQQREGPIPPVPHEPTLQEVIKRLADAQSPILNLAQHSSVFFPLSHAFLDTTFASQCQSASWRNNLWVSKEYQHVIEARGESLDSFLRPPRWVIIYRDEHIIFISPFEANWLIGQLSGQSGTTLRLLLPRMKRHQSILINTPTLTIPRLLFSVPMEWLAELSLFNGTLYFKSAEEQRAYCQMLGLCPKPRTKMEEEAFERGWIANDGFVREIKHRHYLQLAHCRFNSNPLTLVRRILETRHRSHVSPRCHVGAVILEANKLLS